MPKHSRRNYPEFQDPDLQALYIIYMDHDPAYLVNIVKRIEGSNFSRYRHIFEAIVTGRPADPDVLETLLRLNIRPDVLF